MMLETSVPLCMRTAREEFLSALGAPSKSEAEFFRRRANRILRGAVLELQREADLDYDWALLRAAEENEDA